MRILYDSKNLIHKSPFGCVEEGGECRMSIHIPSSCRTKRVTVCFKGEENLTFELVHKYTKDAYDIMEGCITLTKTGLYFYYFHIDTEESSFDLYKFGFDDTNIGDGELWQLSCIPKNYKTPDFFKGKVMYQIFPDRFFKQGDCDLGNKLTPFVINNTAKPHYLPDQNGEILNNDFFGGNLKGIEERLPYIKELGTDIIYLNPIFKAFSNHRYDTCDYKYIDPMLGTEEDFVSLCTKAHDMGMKIILDGVFSHTGSDSIYFDAKNRFGTGVCSNTDSPYKSWFNLREDGSYESWWGIKTLPCVNELSEDFVEYIISGTDSVVRHWLKLGADGFRLDVADELPDRFIKLLREEVKKINSDALVLGEVWEDASNKVAYDVRRRYFTDMELDSVMNYPFRDAIILLLKGEINTCEFANKIMTITENYPHEVVHCLMNSLSTHDTPRIMTMLSGAPLNMSREQNAVYELSEEEIQTACRRIGLAVMLQFFLPGCACIYYGDETGMQGFADPFNRAPFDWEEPENELSDLVKALARIKNEKQVFRNGDIRFISSNDSVLVMERNNGNESVTAAVNLSNKSLKVCCPSYLACHNATCIGDTVYVQKYGFVIY